MRPEIAQAPLDARIARLALAQHGPVATRQLLALGMGRRAIAHRAARGNLHRHHRGVYTVGDARLGPKGHWMAAVLAAGEGSVLSHQAAAALWNLRPSAAQRIDVTVPGRGGRASRPGLRLHRCALAPDETTTDDGIPVTCVARTLLDLAGVVARRALERALDQAETLAILDLDALHATIARCRRRPGASRLRVVLADWHPDAVPTRSALEDRALVAIAAAGLPRPIVNGRVLGLEVDLHWPAERVVVELDSRRHHDTTHAFEIDRERDLRLQVGGWATARLTDRRLRRDTPGTMSELAALLAARTQQSVLP